MKNKYLLIKLMLLAISFGVIITFFLIANRAIAADCTTWGYVKDHEGNPYSGITVNVAGWPIYTNQNGCYSISSGAGTSCHDPGADCGVMWAYLSYKHTACLEDSSKQDYNGQKCFGFCALNHSGDSYARIDCDEINCKYIDNNAPPEGCQTISVSNPCNYSMDVNITNPTNAGWDDWAVGNTYRLEALLKKNNSLVAIVDNKAEFMELTGDKKVKWTYKVSFDDGSPSISQDNPDFANYFEIHESGIYNTIIEAKPKHYQTKKRYFLEVEPMLEFKSYNCGNDPSGENVSVSYNNRSKSANNLTGFISKAWAASQTYYSFFDPIQQISYPYTGSGTPTCYNTGDQAVGRFIVRTTVNNDQYYSGDVIYQNAISVSGTYCTTGMGDSGTYGISSCTNIVQCGGPDCLARMTPAVLPECLLNIPCETEVRFSSCAEVNNKENTCQHWCATADGGYYKIRYYSASDVIATTSKKATVLNPVLATDKDSIEFEKCIDENTPATPGVDYFNIYNDGFTGAPNMKATWDNQNDAKDKISIGNMETSSIFSSTIQAGGVGGNQKTFNLTPNNDYLNNHKPTNPSTIDLTTIKINAVHQDNENLTAINNPKNITVKVKYKQCKPSTISCNCEPSSGEINKNTFNWTANITGFCPEGRSPLYQWFEGTSCNGAQAPTDWLVNPNFSRSYDSAGNKAAYVRSDCGPDTETIISQCCSCSVTSPPPPTCTITGPECVINDTIFDLTYSTFYANLASINENIGSVSVSNPDGTTLTTPIKDKVANTIKTYIMDVSGDGGTSSCSHQVEFKDKCDTERNLKGIFIAGKVTSTSSEKIKISQDSHVINNPPPGFNDLFAPLWKELVP